jgi:hypothetical protein
VTVLGSSPAPSPCPENDGGGFGILTANGRRVLIVSTLSALFAEMPLAVMPCLVSVRCSPISARMASGLEPSAPDLTVMAHTAITLPAMSEHAHSAPAGRQENAAARMTRPFRIVRRKLRSLYPDMMALLVAAADRDA